MSKYRIQAVAQITGLSPSLIRAWEARYRLVVPQRSAGGYRLYSDEDVAVLRGAQRRLLAGMAPMEVAALGRGELLGAAASLEAAAPALAPAPAALAALAEPGPPPIDTIDKIPGPAALPALGLFSERIDLIIAAFAAFDRRRAEQLLGPPLATLPTEVASEHLLVPLLAEMGERWHRGELSIAAEHFGSGFIRGKLLAILETLRHRPGAHRILCACPLGERHEIGLMVFALRAAAQGWDTVYLGADLPASGLGEAAAGTAPDLVALSITRVLPEDQLRRTLEEARAAIAPWLPLLVGGRGVTGHERVARLTGARLLPCSGQIIDLLASDVAPALLRHQA